MRIAKTCLLFVLFGLAACGGLPASRAQLAPVGETLPPIFGPLTWDLSRDQAMVLFPGKEARDDIPGYDGDEPLAITEAWGLDWPDIGPAYIIIAHDGSDRVRWLGVETSESREVCQTGDENSRSKTLGCRSDYGVQLTSVLDRLKTRLSKAYGEPELFTGPSEYSYSDKRERSYKWRRDGFDLSAAITTSEEGTWAVSLYAIRQTKKLPPA